jgi:predicted Zn-dependent peptidase
LGNNILGTVETVKSFSKEDLQNFINRNLDTSRIIVSFVGPTPFSKVIRLVEKYLYDVGTATSERHRSQPVIYAPSKKTVIRQITQAQCAMGRPAFALSDPRRLPFFMLVNLLGGPGMNSRFNMALREKYGFVYTIDASYTPYLDTGFLGIYFGTEPLQLERSIYLIHKELKKLRQQPLTTLQLHHTKEQLMGQLAMSEESNSGYMLMMAKSLLDSGKVDSLPEIFEEIKNVSSTQLADLANEMFDEKEFSYLTFVPDKTAR